MQRFKHIRSVWFVLVTVLMLALMSSVQAQDTTTQISVLSHQVHKDAVMGTGSAGVEDISPALAEATGVTINWETVPWPDMQERVLRELALSDSNFSTMFIISQWLSPSVESQLMPLNDFLDQEPIENFDQMPAGLMSFTTASDGSIYAIPFAAYGPVLFYNTEILGAHGYSEAPTTFEEMFAMMKEVAGRRDDGARVYAIRLQPDTLIDWARAYGGDAITTDFQLKLTEEPMIHALNDVKELYDMGAIPPDFMNLVADDWLTLEQNGQVAFSMRGPAYYNSLNDPTISQAAGHIGVSIVPASETVDYDQIPGNVSFWSMSIPRNSADPAAAWRVIQYLSSDNAALQMAVNGQSPVKPSVYDDPAFAAAAGPWLEPARESLAVARPDWPAFDNLARVQDIFNEQVVLAVTGQKTPEQAMADAADQIQPLLPQGE